MALLALRDISKTFSGNVGAAKRINLSVDEGDFIVIVGPSGCGKTTLLRMIAGLEDIDEGAIELDGVEISKTAPRDRNIAMIFQDFALYPHLTVYDNIAFPLRMRRFPRAKIKQMVEEISHSLQIDKVLYRKPNALSGGQRQRVAISRALVRKPKICLMDEPFSNLDAQMRIQMRNELARIYTEYGMTVVFVTHDQTEAMALGTSIVIMKDGTIQQVASSSCIYKNPANLFVASFFGSPPMNVYPARLVCIDGVWRVCLDVDKRGSNTIEDASIVLDQVCGSNLNDERHQSRVVLGIRPEHILVIDAGSESSFCFDAKIERIENFGSESYLHAEFCGSPLVVRVEKEFNFAPGASMCFSFDSSNCHIFDHATGENLLSSSLRRDG